jgi:hypothetical protein
MRISKKIKLNISKVSKSILKKELKNLSTPLRKPRLMLLKEINLEISQLEKLIDNDIILEAVRNFEQRHYNYDNIDLVK